LARPREEHEEGDAKLRAEIMDAMLLCCGELGYRQVTVEQICCRYGGYRSQFYEHFANKGACYLAAYEAEADRLYARLTAFSGQPEGSSCVRTRLQDLARYAVEDSARAKAVVVEVHVAGGDALVRRREFLERLSHALDRACRETRSRHSPPPLTAEFMISAVEQTLSSALIRERIDEFASSASELGRLIEHAYSAEDRPLRP
jgi:AcrR family transcriptional regulator